MTHRTEISPQTACSTLRRWRRPLLLSVASASLVLVAAGCGSSSGSSPPSSSAGAARSSATVATASVPSVGRVLVGPNGHTLYTLATDTAGTTTCTGACATAWPPLTLPSGTTPTGAPELGTLTRPDGSVQVTAQGHPLYFYAADSAEGQDLGQGLGGVWFVAKPAGSSSTTTTTTPRVSGGY
jgi:predicted lipoprotein with Yx(FWY)xxD motif